MPADLIVTLREMYVLCPIVGNKRTINALSIRRIATDCPQRCENSCFPSYQYQWFRSGIFDKCAFGYCEWSGNERGPSVAGWPILTLLYKH